MGRRKREALKPSFILNNFTVLKVSLLRIKVYFLKNCIGHLFHKFIPKYPVMLFCLTYDVLYGDLEFLLPFDAPVIKATKPDLY